MVLTTGGFTFSLSDNVKSKINVFPHSLALMQSTNDMVLVKQSESSTALEYKIFGWGWNNFGQVSSSAPSILREALELQSFNWREILYVAAG